MEPRPHQPGLRLADQYNMESMESAPATVPALPLSGWVNPGWRWLGAALAILFLLAAAFPARAASPFREALHAAIVAEDIDAQLEAIKKSVEANDPFVERALAAWRQGGLYLHETADGSKIPFLLESETDGKSKGLKLLDGQPLTDPSGTPLTFFASELTAADTTSKLRRAIKTTLDLIALADPDPKARRDAIVKLGQDPNAEYLPFFEERLGLEKDKEAKRALSEAIALTRLADEAPETRLKAIQALAEMRSINGLTFLKQMEASLKGGSLALPASTVAALRSAIVQIENYMFYGNLVGTFFRGVSLSAVLLVVALGLAITFGLMGVINMAHGELMMAGAYAAFVTQNLFVQWFGASGTGFDLYFLAALPVSFVVAGVFGLILERSVIRFLYSRPLESLLATWGVSLVLQQVFRATFGAANVQVSSPSWLSGSFNFYDVLFAYNRIFVIGFAVFIVLLTYFILFKTPVGLQVRAVMQNRSMAACIGVRTDRVNMVTFAFGSGLAGMAGACLSQIGNVGPSLGQNYIVDCFMIVVLGGVGNLIGTIAASFGIGVTDQILQPFLGAVMGKILVLAGIILFLQWRPAGLFVTKTRSLEG